jgi:hypothetical protein
MFHASRVGDYASAKLKKSFSKVNSPILACSAVTSILGVAVASPKTTTAPS